MKKIILLMALSGVLFSCSNDDNDNVEQAFDGSEQAVENFVTPEVLQTMQDMGMSVNFGDNPPNIEGEYLAHQLRLLASNILTDSPNQLFNDMYFTFTNQSTQNLTIDMIYSQTGNGENEYGSGTGIYISGDGNDLKVTVTSNGDTGEAIMVFSGTKQSQGIIDFQLANFMIDNNGSVILIQNGQGRVFYDSDNIAYNQ